MYKDESLSLPLVTYSHTADQSIFNILVHKYNLLVFYNNNISHEDNKDKNRVLNIINTTEFNDTHFINL